MSEDVYEVYALAYARVDRRSPENFLGGDPHDVPMPLSYYVWLIVGGGRTIVVDTGFDQRGADLRKREITRPVGAALTAFGVDLEAVEAGARYWGSRAKISYAEPFETPRFVWDIGEKAIARPATIHDAVVEDTGPTRDEIAYLRYHLAAAGAEFRPAAAGRPGRTGRPPPAQWTAPRRPGSVARRPQ